MYEVRMITYKWRGFKICVYIGQTYCSGTVTTIDDKVKFKEIKKWTPNMVRTDFREYINRNFSYLNKMAIKLKNP